MEGTMRRTGRMREEPLAAGIATVGGKAHQALQEEESALFDAVAGDGSSSKFPQRGQCA